MLDTPDLVDKYYLNLLDWGNNNVLPITLGNTLYLWDVSSGSMLELVTTHEDDGPITSVSWAPAGRDVPVGLNSSNIKLWGSSSNRLLRTLRGVHESRVGSLTWNKSIMTTGGMDGKIVNNDVRVRNHVVQMYRRHRQEVCGLKWSGSRQQPATRGNDTLLHIWDVSMASSKAFVGRTQWLHRLDSHVVAVKALAWCPFQSNLLESSGGGSDRCINFWNTHTSTCLNSIDTGSQSPDGCTVASAAADETLRFWKVFETPEEPKPVDRASHPGLLNSFNHIR